MQKELDWLALSRLPPHNAENIFAIADILKGATVTPEMFQRLPKSYLNKFFTTIQTQMLTFSHNHPQLQQVLKIKSKQRDDLVDKVKKFEIKLTKSKQNLDQKKKNVQVLEQTLKRLQNKLTKKSKIQAKEVISKPSTETLYCPYCKIDGFSNRDQFQNHMLVQHPIKQNQDNNHTLKEVVLALKQKEMALMQMVLKRNEDVVEMNRKLADQQLSFKTKQFQSAQHFSMDAFNSQNLQKQPELASQTEFVWFQKQNDPLRSNEINLNEFNTNRSEYQKSHYYQTNKNEINAKTHQADYYKKSIQQSYPPYLIEFTPSSHIQKVLTLKQEFDIGTKLGLYTTQKEPTKIYKTTSLQYQNSLYQTKNLSKISSGYHIYHAGPLEDDQSDSQASDYFNVKQKPRVIDEQIIVPSHFLQNKINNTYKLPTIKTISSPKSGDKTLNSALYSLLSVEDRDFSLSKDSNSINLSDLRYEDLLIQKQLQKKNQSPSLKQQLKEPSNLFFKKTPDQLLLNEFYQSDVNEFSVQLPMKKISSYNPYKKTTLLDEFMVQNKKGNNYQNQQIRKIPISQTFENRSNSSSLSKKRKMQRTQNGNKQFEVPKLEKQCTQIQQRNQFNFPIMQQSLVNYEQTPRDRNNPSEPATERLILQTLIDLTLIRQQQLQQSING